MIKRLIPLLLVISLFFILLKVATNVAPNYDLTGVAKTYAEQGASDLGAMNLVTAIVVTYRGLDTLGEVTVLFMAGTGIALLLRRKKKKNDSGIKNRAASEILKTGSKLLVPIITMFGAYIFINGHLSPGGGFQGGAAIASAVMLMFLADSSFKINHKVFVLIESFSGIFYVLIGVLGLVILGADNFLDNRILPLGTFGTILSAGTIPLIYTLVGLKVGTELASILDNMKGELE
ncbi:MAG: Na(+)/H(+) antiporter subunit B [Candidatus Delongbacteria bacterium]|nr:Na(+)/H(+) antiporter subunit B [Candidatus Delongbacteria bacterium]